MSTLTPPPYTLSLSPASPASSSRPPSAASLPDLPEIDLTPIPDDLPPSFSDYSPAPPEPLPEYPQRPSQYVFLSLDVLNSLVVDVSTGERVMQSTSLLPPTLDASASEEDDNAPTSPISPTSPMPVSPLSPSDTSGGETLIRSLSTSPDSTPVARIRWPSPRKARLGPLVDFGPGPIVLRKWMARTGHPSALLRIRHRGRMYDVYQAGGQALGVRYTPTKQRKSTRNPMLLGIRDPNKHTELIVSAQLEGDERGKREVLELGVVLVVLLKSKRQLGADFEERRVRDKILGGVWRVFDNIGKTQRGHIMVRAT